MRYCNSFACKCVSLMKGDQSPKPPEVFRFVLRGSGNRYLPLQNRKERYRIASPHRNQQALELVLTIALSSIAGRASLTQYSNKFKYSRALSVRDM